jgi:Ca2+-binding RTX toxin-like protein
MASRRTAVGAVAAVLAAVGAAPASAAEEERCGGSKVTISWQDRGVDREIRGTSRRDVIQGGPNAETIFGEGGDDVICGGPGKDSMGGGAGFDELRGESENDTLGLPVHDSDPSLDIVIGGGGRDIADYASARAPIRLSLKSGTVVAEGARRRGGIHGVEAVFGSNGGDHLIGDAQENTLAGLGGNDFIDGLGEDDDLLGGAGIDEISYFSAQEPVELHIGDFAEVGRGRDSKRDRLDGFEIAFGSEFDDELLGSSEREVLHGREGDDVIKGLEENDGLAGEEGDDVLFPGPGDDKVDGGPSDPVTGANEHGDLVSYQGDETTDSPDDNDQQPDILDLNLGPLTVGGLSFPAGASGVGTDLFRDIESARGTRDRTSSLDGSEGPNVLIGGRKFDSLRGFGGNDFLYGLGSGDAIVGGDGDDYLAGGGATGDESSEDGSRGTDLLNGEDGIDTCVDGWSYSNCEAGDQPPSAP